MIEQFQGQDLDPHYLGYIELFNQELFYEAHDVLEELWLDQRNTPEGDFSKGLIQLAGAFVHLQKNRLRPAAALFKLAHNNLVRYPELHQRVDVEAVLLMIQHWLQKLEKADFAANPLTPGSAPELRLSVASSK